MCTRSKLLSAAIAIVLAVALGSCSRTFGAKEDAAGGNSTTEAADGNSDASGTTTTTADPNSIPTVPMNGPIQTLPRSDPKPVPSKAPQTVPPSDGFGGKPPSFPDFTFTATRTAGTTVSVTGSGCAGGKVELYPESSGSGEGGDPVSAAPDASGNWSATLDMAAGKLKGVCVAIGSGGQSHVGGSHTVTIP